MNKLLLKEKIDNADLILIGIGEEFTKYGCVLQDDKYLYGKKLLLDHNLDTLLPAWLEFCNHILNNDIRLKAVGKLINLIDQKNYFMVSTIVDSGMESLNWKEGRVVFPCGTNSKLQCSEKCNDHCIETDKEQMKGLEKLFDALWKDGIIEGAFSFGECKDCGAKLVLNNIYSAKYNENGYLEAWGKYTKWLQGTLNKKLLILELGVNLDCPSVIRWPFEKIAFYNNKAEFVRVNETLFQLTEELANKGIGVHQNTIEWLLNI